MGVYAMIAVPWFLILLPEHGFQYSIHNGLSVVVLLAFLECFSTYLMCRWWNMSGSRSGVLGKGVLIFNSLKYVSALRLLLLVGSCRGNFRIRDHSPYTVKFRCVALIFLVQQCMSKLLLQARHGFCLEPTFVLPIFSFGSLICFGIFVWVFIKYVCTGELKSQAGKDNPFVKLFTATRRVVLLTSALAACVVTLQLADIYWDSTPWRFQWIPHDVSPHLAFFIFTVLMMNTWWPKRDLWKLAYTQQVTTHEVQENDGHDGPEDDPEIAEKVEEEEEEVCTREDFLVSPEKVEVTPGKGAGISYYTQQVQPDTLGASSHCAHEDEDGPAE